MQVMRCEGGVVAVGMEPGMRRGEGGSSSFAWAGRQAAYYCKNQGEKAGPIWGADEVLVRAVPLYSTVGGGVPKGCASAVSALKLAVLCCALLCKHVLVGAYLFFFLLLLSGSRPRRL